MSKKFLFPCSCGLDQPIEASQAGQTIVCPSCGAERRAPTLMKIKELPSVPEEVVAKKETGNLRRAFFWLGLFLLVPSSIYLALILYFYLFPFHPDLFSPLHQSSMYDQVVRKLNYPHPRDVTKKRVEFSFGGKTLTQDSTPLSDFEQEVLWLEDDHFKMMMPIQVFYHFNRLGDSPNLGYNFQENYQALKDAYSIRIAVGIVLFALAILSLVASCFMPRRDVEVVGWSGTDWK